MSNIVYVLTNPAMPGIVKIGMTDNPDVQLRMGQLYTTGVPFPFDCVIAREIVDREAVEIESALHTAFGPNRINPSREFFQLEPEQVEVLLRVMPGKDVTPPDTDQSAALSPDDREASSEFKKKQSQTNEEEFLASLDENGKTVCERVLALGKQGGMRIKWHGKGFHSTWYPAEPWSGSATRHSTRKSTLTFPRCRGSQTSRMMPSIR